VAALLKTAWERDYRRIVAPGEVIGVINAITSVTKDALGDSVGVHLIEAYLQDGKPGEADEIFKAVLDCGGKFKNISQIIALAKAKSQDRLAAQWEDAVAKAGGK